MRDSRSPQLARYKTRRARRGPVGWQSGPTNAIDRLIDYSYSAVEIAHELGLDRWLIVERFAARSIVDERLRALDQISPSGVSRPQCADSGPSDCTITT